MTQRARAMWHTMAQMQDEHNTQVHPQWREQGYAYYRAIWVECAEMLDHYGWKWWKHQEADIEQVKLELVDIWHFGLSEMMRTDTLDEALADVLLEIEPAADAEGFRLAIERLAMSSLHTQGFDIQAFAHAMRTLPMSFAELFSMYVGKNVLNRLRQNHGYKTGEYIKQWQGREDNEHLVELLDELREESDSLPDKLYAALQSRYQELTRS